MTGCNQCGETRTRPLFSTKGYDLVACSGCGLAYIANPPDAAELARIYSADASYHTALKDPASKAWADMAGIARQHMAFLATIAGEGTLLDVGCSTGLFLDLARTAGFAVKGVEFSEESAGFARDHFGLTVERGSIHDCTDADGSYDVLTMFDVIEHVPDPLADMAAALRLLKPGAWFVLSTPNIDGLFPRASYPLANALNYWPHPEPPYHLYQFSVQTLTAMLAKAGFAPGPVRHHAIALDYTFGSARDLVRMPKRLAYALAFAPLAKLGPLIGMGDWFYIAARKPG
ncbi:MAG: class I SAM-dependent methyltransferase [Novosphingobium sp.]